MTEDEALERYGLRPAPDELPEIRALLEAHRGREAARQGDGDTELMRVLCVLLFAGGEVADAITIHRVKRASMDASGIVDVQMLCGAGLERTRAWLKNQGTADAAAALACIEDFESFGELEGFTVEGYLADCHRYYGLG